MKRMLKGLTGFAVVLVLVIGVVATVFAQTSKSHGVEIASDNEWTVNEDATGWTPITTQQAAQMIGGGVTADQLTIIWQYVIEAETPATFDFTYDAVKSDQRLYVFHNAWKSDGSGTDVWDKLVATGATGSKTVTATFDDLSPVALVLYTVGGIVAGVAVRKNKA